MIRTAALLLAALISTSAFAAPNVAREEAFVLDLVRSSILDESDNMHTGVKKGATQYSVILDENNDEIGYAVVVTIAGYSYEQGNYEQTFRVETRHGGIVKVERVK
jgi:hypothetical protein